MRSTYVKVTARSGQDMDRSGKDQVFDILDIRGMSVMRTMPGMFGMTGIPVWNACITRNDWNAWSTSNVRKAWNAWNNWNALKAWNDGDSWNA